VRTFCPYIVEEVHQAISTASQAYKNNGKNVEWSHALASETMVVWLITAVPRFPTRSPTDNSERGPIGVGDIWK
jgi:hypothetical protein